MSKKTELKTLIIDVAYNMDEALSSAQKGNEYMYKSYMADAHSQGSQIEYLLGSREPEFSAKVELTTALYGCSDSQMDAYMDNMDLTSYQRCIGIMKLAYINAIEEMF
jgi:hypothetical protein|tara:strand:+ start:169 stop:492 length:324 start_codon:yes stop_codon:yes gene_type:complete